MATKLQLYSSLANSTAENLTKSRSNWTGFLEITARLYKYPYAEQIMIYAQRPDATACASIETWNKPMNRWVRRGSKGIALIDSSGSRPRLKYVFDVSDTEAGRQNPQKTYLWEMQYEHEAPIMEALAKSYGEMEGNLGDILYNIAQELSKEYLGGTFLLYFISQIMTSKSPMRSCEDVDETSLSYAEIKALCAGNPLIKERMDLDVDVSRLRLMKADYQSQHYMLEDNLLKYYPEQIKQRTEQIQGFEKDAIILEQHTPKSQNPAEPAPFAPMTLQGQVYDDKGKAGAALLEVCKTIKSTEPVKIGSYRGFNMHLSFDSFDKSFTLTLKGAMSYRADLGTDFYGNITRINNALAEIPQRLNSVKTHLENVHNQMADAKEELEKSFPQKQKLEEKSTRLTLLDAQLNMDGRQHEETPSEEIVAKRKPSILETLRNNTNPNQSKFIKGKSTDIAR